VNVSPPLAWTGVPAGTQSFAIAMDDPDAPGGTFTHWLTWGIDASARSLAEGASGAAAGRNDAGSSGYFGPCPPPPDGAHRYVFHLYALSAPLTLASGSSRAGFNAALQGKVLREAVLTGTFDR
jgi:Raf kinase inhibitor-like YbhB/YbcL family protein